MTTTNVDVTEEHRRFCFGSWRDADHTVIIGNQGVHKKRSLERLYAYTAGMEGRDKGGGKGGRDEMRPEAAKTHSPYILIAS